MVISDRYNRQDSLIKGWEQEKLKESRAILIGSDRLSDLLFVDLLSLGIGDITRIGNSNFLEFEKINPEVYSEQINEELTSLQLAEIYLENANFIIDTTNNPQSKLFSSHVAKNRNIPYLSGSASQSSFTLSTTKKEQELVNFHEKEYNSKQGILNSIVCSGFLIDEIRKKILNLKDDICIESLKYSDIRETNLEKKVLQVGAGAIGTFSALALSLMNTNLTIVDFDSIEETNLNRQFLFYNAVGENKAETLVKRLSKYSNKIKAKNEKIGQDFKPKAYDFVFSCVDNNEARYHMNNACSKYNVPLINGGTSLFAGNSMPYFPGKTACLDCQEKLSESIKLKQKKKRRAGECFQPSLIIPNQIIGGLMINCLTKSLQGVYEKSNYVSGVGIYNQEINKTCSKTCTQR